MFPTALLCIISIFAILYSKIKYIAEKKEKTKKISSLLITICLICGVVFLKSLDDLSIVNIVILYGLCINILLGIIAIIIFAIANENFKDNCIKILKKIKVSFLLLVPYIIWHMDNVLPQKDILGIIVVILLIVALASLFGAAITSIFKKGKKSKVIKTFLKVAKDVCVLFAVICLVYPFYSIEEVVAILRPTIELAASITLLILFIMLVILEIVSKIKHVKIKDSEKVEKTLHITIIVLLLMGMINTYYVI